MAIESLLDFSRTLRLSSSVILLGESVPFTENDDTAQLIRQSIGECTEEQQRGILEIIRLFTIRP